MRVHATVAGLSQALHRTARSRALAWLWVLCLVAGLYVTACSTALVTGIGIFSADGGGRQDHRTVMVSLDTDRPTFVTQATVGRAAANIHHFTIKLYGWNVGTSTLGGLVHTHFTTSGQPRV